MYTKTASHSMVCMDLHPSPTWKQKFGRACSINEIDSADPQRWKSGGFTDGHIADALSGFQPGGITRAQESEVMARRHALDNHPIYRMVTHVQPSLRRLRHTIIQPMSVKRPRGLTIFQTCSQGIKRQIVLWIWTDKTGQGIEFDYSCVHAVKSIRSEGMDVYSSTIILKPSQPILIHRIVCISSL